MATSKQDPTTVNTALADALKGITEVLRDQQTANTEREAGLIGDAMKEATKPRVNQSPPRISAHNPQGDKDYPRPALKFEKIFLPFEGEPEQFTYEELELINRLQPGEYWVSMNDGTRQLVKIRVTENDITRKPEKLYMESAMFNTENKSRVKPMVEMLREILGEAADGIVSMPERRRLVVSGELPISVGA